MGILLLRLLRQVHSSTFECMQSHSALPQQVSVMHIGAPPAFVNVCVCVASKSGFLLVSGYLFSTQASRYSGSTCACGWACGMQTQSKSQELLHFCNTCACKHMFGTQFFNTLHCGCPRTQPFSVTLICPNHQASNSPSTAPKIQPGNYILAPPKLLKLLQQVSVPCMSNL